MIIDTFLNYTKIIEMEIHNYKNIIALDFIRFPCLQLIQLIFKVIHV
jgi:hypothetical protein